MENRSGDFATASALFDDACADKAWAVGGQGGERPGVRRKVLAMLRRSCLSEYVDAADSKGLARAFRGNDALQQTFLDGVPDFIGPGEGAGQGIVV